MTPWQQGAPAALGALFAPYASMLGGCSADVVPSLEQLNACAAQADRPPTSSCGAAVRFASATVESAADYELRIRDHGEVGTRADNWHDVFNALVWCAFPATKAALNARHCAQIEQGNGRARGQQRDALSLFDECGVLAVSSDATLIDALRGHRWEEALWHRRTAIEQEMRFLVVGHATLDALRKPFAGLCAKVLYREVPRGWFSRSSTVALVEADDWLARWFADDASAIAPASFAPLPLLGIPGVCADNDDIGYYRDSDHFRPRRAPGLSGLRCV